LSNLPKRTPKVLASAVWKTHGLVMNGGVLHAVEVLKPAELDTAIAGYEHLGFPGAAGVLLRAKTLGDSDKDTEEARLDREYATAVPDDASLEDAMDRVDPPPESGVGTKDESDEALVETYRIAARDHGRANASGDYRSGNRAHKRLALAYRTLRARGPGSQAKLLHLLRDRDVAVQGWAAAHALEFAPVAGEAVLAELTAQPGPVAFSARMTLQEWRAGRLRFP
jgi:hypothetical protein